MSKLPFTATGLWTGLKIIVMCHLINLVIKGDVYFYIEILKYIKY